MSDGTLFDAPAAVNFIICRQCGDLLSPDCFYPNCKKCKRCVCENVRTNRSQKRKQYSAYEQMRFKTPERKRQMIEAQRRRRERYPEKNAARQAVTQAIRTGKLERSTCEICGSADVQAHHEDYSKPLEIRWLCFKHHREIGHNQVVICEGGAAK